MSPGRPAASSKPLLFRPSCLSIFFSPVLQSVACDPFVKMSLTSFPLQSQEQECKQGVCGPNDQQFGGVEGAGGGQRCRAPAPQDHWGDPPHPLHARSPRLRGPQRPPRTASSLCSALLPEGDPRPTAGQQGLSSPSSLKGTALPAATPWGPGGAPTLSHPHRWQRAAVRVHPQRVGASRPLACRPAHPPTSQPTQQCTPRLAETL